MPLSLYSTANLTLLTLTSIFLFCVSSSPSVLAQKFRPAPDYGKCAAFVEGQAFYLLGGEKQENFILDLSVSWNTSDPAFKKLEGGPKVGELGCTMTNNREDLFVISVGTGYIYNVRSNSWKVFHSASFELDTYDQIVSDPETGLIYIPYGGEDFRTGEQVMLSVDLRTNQVNSTLISNVIDTDAPEHIIWSAYLKGMVVTFGVFSPVVFTPSKATNSRKGWAQLDSSESKEMAKDVVESHPCAAPAYNDTKIIFLGRYLDDKSNLRTHVYTLDLVKRVWRKGPFAGSERMDLVSCAVSGDFFIAWGGQINEKPSNRTLVFNMKTEKWVSRYIAPPSQPTTTAIMTSYTLQPSQTPTQRIPNTTAALDTSDTSPNEKKLVIIIVAVTGILLAIILGLIFRCHRRTRQPYLNGSSTDSLDTKDDINTFGKEEHSMRSPRRRDPTESGHAQRRWYMTGLLGRLHQGVYGARELSEHPHAIVEDPTARRNVQEGATEVELPMQHPHTTAEHGFITRNDKEEWEPTGSHHDKEEFREH